MSSDDEENGMHDFILIFTILSLTICSVLTTVNPKSSRNNPVIIFSVYGR